MLHFMLDSTGHSTEKGKFIITGPQIPMSAERPSMMVLAFLSPREYPHQYTAKRSSLYDLTIRVLGEDT